MAVDPLKQQTKICPVCQRPFHNRKKWNSRGIWDQIVYCSDKCRKNSKNERKTH